MMASTLTPERSARDANLPAASICEEAHPPGFSHLCKNLTCSFIIIIYSDIKITAAGADALGNPLRSFRPRAGEQSLSLLYYPHQY